MAGKTRKVGGGAPPPKARTSRKPQGGDVPGGGSPIDHCDMAFATPLQSLDPQVVQTLTPGDLLNVVLVPGTPHPSIVCKTASGADAGSIGAAEEIADLIDCIRAGNSYTAEVVNLNTGCLVRVFRSATAVP